MWSQPEDADDAESQERKQLEALKFEQADQNQDRLLEP